MRKYITLFFLGSLFLLSCSGNKPAKGILSPVDMVSLLTDVHTVDGRMYIVMQNPDSLYLKGMGHYLYVFKQHHTDSTQFKNSLKYYSGNPNDLSVIYDSVASKIKHKIDSLNNAQYNKHALPRK